MMEQFKVIVTDRTRIAEVTRLVGEWLTGLTPA